MRKTLHIVLPCLLLLAVGCDFRQLSDPVNVSYVRIYIDEDIPNVTKGFYDEHVYEDVLGMPAGTYTTGIAHPEYHRPEILRLGLFDHASGALAAERYLRNQGDDERGHYYDGYLVLNPGEYDLVAYNFGTESTVVSEESNGFRINAHTNEITPSMSGKFKSRTKPGEALPADETIRYDADHLFLVEDEAIKITRHHGLDTLRNKAGDWYFRARSIVISYYLQIGIVNAQYVASSVALLGGMSGGVRLLDGDISAAGESTLYFGMSNGRYPEGYVPEVSDYQVLYTTFGTFGRLSKEENHLQVSFEFITTYGQTYSETLDIALEFEQEEAIEHQWLILDYVITIPPPPDDPDTSTSGGMTPSVDEWGDVHSEFEI